MAAGGNPVRLNGAALLQSLEGSTLCDENITLSKVQLVGPSRLIEDADTLTTVTISPPKTRQQNCQTELQQQLETFKRGHEMSKCP